MSPTLMMSREHYLFPLIYLASKTCQKNAISIVKGSKDYFSHEDKRSFDLGGYYTAQASEIYIRRLEGLLLIELGFSAKKERCQPFWGMFY